MNSPILDIKNIQRKIDQVTVIKNITAQVHAGDVVALLGKNGAGKTTLLETLLGFSHSSFGNVKLWGIPATHIDGKVKQRIGFVPQQNELILGITGRAHLDLFKSFREHWNQPLVDKLIADWSIPMEINLGKMSLGQQQKLSILLAMAHEPDLLVLDEPVASLDPIARRQFLQQLVEIAADGSRAIIFSSHIVSDMERIANQVWMLQNGELGYQGGLDELKESIARITIRSGASLEKNLVIENAVRQKITGKEALITIKKWRPELQAEIAEKFNAAVDVEYLSLEDIFLELNT